MSNIFKSIKVREFFSNMLFIYFLISYHIVKFQFYCVNISYLVDRCICPARCRSRQTLEKNASSWALARTVVSCLLTRWLYSLPAGALRVRAHAYFLLLFGAKTRGRLSFGETFILFYICYRIYFGKLFV